MSNYLKKAAWTSRAVVPPPRGKNNSSFFCINPITKPSLRGFFLHRHTMQVRLALAKLRTSAAQSRFLPSSLLPASVAMTLHQPPDKPVNSSCKMQGQPSTKHLTWLHWSRVSRDLHSWALWPQLSCSCLKINNKCRIILMCCDSFICYYDFYFW